MYIYTILNKLFRPNGKISFLSSLCSNIKILDVGCGNNSSNLIKKLLPESNYTGIDVSNYNQNLPILANHYILTTPENFAGEIFKFENYFDVVISNHNLEHCDDRNSTLYAMLRSLKLGGKFFLAFPCEQSVNFPSRIGTLNYHDDITHKDTPPSFDFILSSISNAGFSIVYSNKNYSPFLLFLCGYLLEPLSIILNRNMIGTWEYYGFESIIIAEKKILS